MFVVFVVFVVFAVFVVFVLFVVWFPEKSYVLMVGEVLFVP